MGLPRAEEGLCERQRSAVQCRLLAPCCVNGNQTSIIAPTTQEGRDRGKAGAGKEHCLIDEQIYLTRVKRLARKGRGRVAAPGRRSPAWGSAASHVGGWARVMRLSFIWWSGASDEDRWVAPGHREGIARGRGREHAPVTSLRNRLL